MYVVNYNGLTWQAALAVLLGFIGMKAGCLAPNFLLFPIFLDPGFPALSSRRVSAAEGKRSDIRICDLQPAAAIFWQDPDKRST